VFSDRRSCSIIHDVIHCHPHLGGGGPVRDVTGTLLKMWSIIAGFLMVAWIACATRSFIIQPHAARSPTRDVAREQEILRQLEEIDRSLSDDFWRRYDQLISMRKAETLVPDSPEHLELIGMTNRMECRHAERLVLLSELANLRGTSLAEVLKHNGVAVWNHG
jgi:hypothetical protein